jgi:hypothetical protein
MVSVTLDPVTLDTRSLQRMVVARIDREIEAVLSGANDPFGAAALLWALARHPVALDHVKALVTWVSDLCWRVLVSREIGPKRDEEIAAAFLGAVALVRHGALAPEDMGPLRSGVAFLVEQDVQPGVVPFGRPGYASGIVLSCATLGLHIPGGETTIGAILQTYGSGGRVARPLGLGFLAAGLAEIDADASLTHLWEQAYAVLEADSLEPEARLTLVHAAWVAAQALDDAIVLRTVPVVEEALEELSMQTTMGGGWEDAMPVSRLYLAALHDLVSGYARRRERLAQQRIEARYQANRSYRWFTFLGVILLPLIMLGAVGWNAWPSVLLTLRIYVRLQVDLAHGPERWQAPLITGVVSYAVIAVLTIVATAFDAIIRRNTESDTYLRERLVHALGHWLWRWTKVLCCIVVATIVLNLASTALTTQLTAH